MERKPLVEEMRSGQIEEYDVAKAGHTALDHVLHVGTTDREGENDNRRRDHKKDIGGERRIKEEKEGYRKRRR